MNLQAYYNDKALLYKIPKKRLNKILELIGDVSGKKILDIGCASGDLGQQIKRKGSCEVTGIDISRKSVKEARKVLDNAMVVDLSQGRLPFKKGQFDIVIFSEVVEHLFNPGVILKEINRILKAGSVLVVTTPNILYWAHRLSFLRGEFKYQKEGPFDEAHIHFFTFNTLLNLVEDSGFKLVKMNNLYPGSDLLSVIKNMFPGVFAYQLIFLCTKRNEKTLKKK